MRGLALLLAAAVLLPLVALACSDSDPASGGASFLNTTREIEMNDTPATATDVKLGRVGIGNLFAVGDVDYWRIALEAGVTYEIAPLVSRMDQARWDQLENGVNIALFADDGVTPILRQDAVQWVWGVHDRGLASFTPRVAASFVICVRTVDDTAPGATYALWVRPAPRTGVTQFEEESATNPLAIGVNDSTATAQPIVPGSLIGEHADDDLDYFSFTITAPSILLAEVVGYRAGIARNEMFFFDPALQLVDQDGATVLRGNDDAIYFDPALNYALLTPGTYFLLVTECCGPANSPYELLFDIRPIGTATEAEPNDTAANATAIGAEPRAISGEVGAGDVDLLSFEGTAGAYIDIHRFAAGNLEGAGFGAVPTVRLLDPAGAPVVVGFRAAVNGLNAILRVSGTYTIELTSASATPLPYTIAIRGWIPGNAEGDAANDDLTTAQPFLPLSDTGGRGEPVVVDPATQLGEGGNALLMGDAVAGAIEAPGDIDMWSFEAREGELVVFALRAFWGANSSGGFGRLASASSLRARVSILNEFGATVATSAYGGDISTEGVLDPHAQTQTAFVAPQTGTFYVEVSELRADAGSADHVYWMFRRR